MNRIKNIIRSLSKKFPFLSRFIKSIFLLPFKNEDILGVVSKELNKIKDEIIFIDVGCYVGGWWKALYENILPFKKIFSVGIDPIQYEFHILYSHFLPIAIDLEEKFKDFHIFEDHQCNSLRELHKDYRKWFTGIPEEIKHLETISIKTMRLDSVIEMFNIQKKIIHYIKIDAQGNDLSVFQSLGKYKINVLFVQLETNLSNLSIYFGQSSFVDDKNILGSFGFKIFYIQNYPDTTNPEADIVYVNFSLYKKIFGQNPPEYHKR